MLDFTSAKYLGFHHQSSSLGSFAELTSGRPAILDDDPDVTALERALAETSGSAAAVLSPSSLHALWDVIALGLEGGFSLLVEDGTYPIALAALSQARSRSVARFAHHDPAALGRALERQKLPVMIVADGVCPTCGRAAPLGAYARAARQRRGLLVIDDTQGFGLFGEGGAGSASAAGADPRATVVVASLAKAFGAPLCVTAGPAWFIDEIRRDGPMRTHASPPNAAAIRAGHAALRCNREVGDRARAGLLTNIHLFRWILADASLEPRGAPFPVQSLAARDTRSALRAQRALAERGVRAIVTTSRCPPREALLTFILTAAHPPDAVARGAHQAAAVLAPSAPRQILDGAGSP